jgi:3-dehydroquinate dehydratase II
MHIHIINGPNLNLLGTRETNIYGNQHFEQYLQQLQQQFTDINITYYQSNIEGELINEIQKTGFSANGIVINPAAYSHTSVAIADAIAAIKTPVVEVHISNIYAREEYRKNSYVSAKAVGIITGFGLEGYKLAVQWFCHHFAKNNTPQ